LIKSIYYLKFLLFGTKRCPAKKDIILQVVIESIKASLPALFASSLQILPFEIRREVLIIFQAILNYQKKFQNLFALNYNLNEDILMLLVDGYKDSKYGLTSSIILQEIIFNVKIRTKIIKSSCLTKLFQFIQLDCLQISTDVFTTLNLLLSSETLDRKKKDLHFLEKYSTKFFFFICYAINRNKNNYLTFQLSMELLSNILSNPINIPLTNKFISQKKFLIWFLPYLKDKELNTRMKCYHIFKHFIDKMDLSDDLKQILLTNRNDIITFLESFDLWEREFLVEIDYVYYKISTLKLIQN